MIKELFSIGPFHVYTYGLMMAISFITVGLLLDRELKRKENRYSYSFPPDFGTTLILSAVIGGVAGSKLYSVLQEGEISFRELFSGSGLGWYGGLIGGAVAVLIVIHVKSSPVWPTIDAIGPLLLLGYAIGRIGCFVSGDGCYGKPTDGWWGMAFPNGVITTTSGNLYNLLKDKGMNIPSGIEKYGTEIIKVHPTPLYEIIMSSILFGILWAIRKKKEKFPGYIFGLYLIFAGIERFIVEFWRIQKWHKIAFGIELTTIQITSIIIFVIGIVLIARSRNLKALSVDGKFV